MANNKNMNKYYVNAKVALSEPCKRQHSDDLLNRYSATRHTVGRSPVNYLSVCY